MRRVNIIGAGLAGLSAAIHLAKSGIECNLISSLPSERAQSVLAEGGINASVNTMGESDTAAEHFADTMRGGVNLADPDAVKGLTDGAPEIVAWLSSIGAALQTENGHLMLRSFGGQKKKRTAYAKSSTGKILMTALIDEARKYEQQGKIFRYMHHDFAELIIDSGRCEGVRVCDTYTGKFYDFYGTVILATGGINGIFPEMTTGTTQNTGNVTAAVFAQGAELANLEFIQYHPTTIGICGKRCLISEAARGEGGRLYVMRGGERWYFMEEKYPELGNLMPRDVVSREMYGVVHDKACGNQVYLDMTGLDKETWEKRLSDLREECIHYLSLDPAREPVPVEPGIHYFMGGIYVDKNHRTSIENLYAAGECACQYHGANRLGGNSMLGAIYGGKVAALDIAERGEAAEAKQTEEAAENIAHDTQLSYKLRDILLSGLGIMRDEKSMTEALARLDELLKTDLNTADKNRILLGKAMLMSALLRKESRGAHTRSDYPDTKEEYRKTTIARMASGEIEITFREIGGDANA